MRTLLNRAADTSTSLPLVDPLCPWLILNDMVISLKYLLGPDAANLRHLV